MLEQEGRRRSPAAVGRIVAQGLAEGRIRPALRGARLKTRRARTFIHDPQCREVRSHEPDELACWLIDTDCNQESFFVHHTCFLGASDPYGNLRAALKAEIDPDAWATLAGDSSGPFTPPLNRPHRRAAHQPLGR